jgi:hypothetical protein
VWHLRRSLDDLQALDRQLHTCVYDRKYSQLPVIPQLENISANGNSLQVGEKCIQPIKRRHCCWQMEVKNAFKTVENRDLVFGICWMIVLL